MCLCVWMRARVRACVRVCVRVYWTFTSLHLRSRTIFYIGIVLISVCVCARARARALARAYVQVCACVCRCVYVRAGVCLCVCVLFCWCGWVYTSNCASWCMSMLSFAYVYMLTIFWDTFLVKVVNKESESYPSLSSQLRECWHFVFVFNVMSSTSATFKKETEQLCCSVWLNCPAIILHFDTVSVSVAFLNGPSTVRLLFSSML